MKSSSSICFLHGLARDSAVGGKARGLARLIAAGFNVPEGLVVMPDARDDEIAAAYRLLGAGPVAVRSSAEGEDSEHRSYAGQFDTFLDISGEEQVVNAVRTCRESALGQRVTSYREDIAEPPARIPVIVQRMIHPDYAGVAFSESGGPMLIEGVRGLADSLVSGRARPTSLPDDVRGRVERVTRTAVERLGGAQDLEWAAEGDSIWLVQARPVTAPLPAPLPDRFRLWTAANVQEAIPRPLTPLSEELTHANMLRIFRASYDFAGLPEPDGPHVRFVRGRPYMSYSAAASAMSAMPDFRIRDLLLMFGDNPTLAPLISYHPGPTRHFLVRIPATLARSVSWFLFAERHIERARKAASQFEAHVQSNLASDPPDARLLELFSSMETWDPAPVEAMSVSTSLANRLLASLMSSSAEPDRMSAVTALSVAGDLESLEPTRRLSAFADWLRGHADRADDDPQVQARLKGFMEACGFRCEEEAELMNPRWGERPADVLRLARQLASAPVDPRAGAAQTTTAAAPSLRLRVLTAQARTWQRRRERTRAILARVGAAVRLLLLAIGRRLHDRKLLGAPDDIFYLLRREIESLLGGSSLETAQRELIVARVEQRRVQHRWMLAAAPPTRLLAELPGGRLVPFEREPKSGGALLGCGASPGRVTARARVVSNFAEARTLEPGEILVTRTTDIGWTPLFRLVSAVVTEIGAPTSHAAIVARELGVPAVVNVDRVTERIRTGDMLFVDGWAGVVRQLESCAESARRDGPGAE